VRKRMKLFHVLVIAFVIVAGGLVTMNQLETDITVLQGQSRQVRLEQIRLQNENGELKKVFFVGTGALMSGISTLQSESIPAVAHGVLLTGG